MTDTDPVHAELGADVSLPIHPDMLHGGRKPTVEQAYSLAAGDDYNVSRWTISAHAGTHVEAPLHTIAGGVPVSALPLADLVGPARVLDLEDVETEVTAGDLERAGLQHDERVLLRTRNSTTVLQERDKAERWVGIAPDAAELLVARGVKVLGVDYLTVESPAREATFDAHYLLNRAGIAIIESVDLSGIAAGLVELICLPVMLEAEAAPARVLIGDAGTAGGAIIDISVPVRAGMVTWGKSPERIEVESLAGGDACNVTRWYMGAHTGTHIDAPLHYAAAAPAIDELELDTFVGHAQVLDLSAATGDITGEDLVGAGLGDATRVLLRTRNSAEGLMHRSAKPSTWIGVSAEAARLLVDRGVQLVGTDFLSLEGVAESAGGWAAHHVLCDAGVAILEGIDLAGVESGEYDLYALPIPLRGSEAAPARAFLRRREG